MIQGTTITLHIKTQAGVDAFGCPLFTDSETNVENVVISPVDASAVVQDLQLYGKHTAYQLHIPKGNTDTWTDTEVEFWGKKFRTFGPMTEYMEELTPGDWNKSIRVEVYE